MNSVLAILCAGGVVYAVVCGNSGELSAAAAGSATDAAELWFTVAAAMMFWSGMMRVAEKAGLTKLLCRAVRPLLGRLLPDIGRDSRAMQTASLNLVSNLLGLGNAAMPSGIETMRELGRTNAPPRTMAAFVLLNTSSVQLIPMNLITLRAKAGSHSPADCVLPIIINSLLALSCGLMMITLIYGGKRNAMVRTGGTAAYGGRTDCGGDKARGHHGGIQPRRNGGLENCG